MVGLDEDGLDVVGLHAQGRGGRADGHLGPVIHAKGNCSGLGDNLTNLQKGIGTFRGTLFM